MRWFRYYDDALDDPKVQLLSDCLFKTWVNLLSLASKNEGKIPSVDTVAFRLRISIQDAQQRMDELILAGLIDIQPDGTFAPHNWGGRQFSSDSSAARVQKFRTKKREKKQESETCNVTCNDDVTLQSHSQIQNRIESLGHSLPTEPARETRKDDQKVLSKFLKTTNDRTGQLEKRAEGLGLDVAELTSTVNRHKAKNRPAYFTSLCVDRLQKKLPGLDEQIIRDALWEKRTDAYQRVIELLMVSS